MRAKWNTELRRDIGEFLRFKRALGFSYECGERSLREFERLFSREGRKCRCVNAALKIAVATWLSTTSAGRKPQTIATNLGPIRQFCLYRRRHDPSAFVPDISWAPRTRSTFKPHVFSKDEVRRVVKSATVYRKYRLGPLLLRTLVLILYCTGLRPGEAVRLKLSDTDLKQRMFFIRESKGRSRFVPFGEDLAREINGYLRERVRIVRAAGCTNIDALFLRTDGSVLTMSAAGDAIREVLHGEGIKGGQGKAGPPRPYDFRHAFAVQRLTEWYRQGADIHARLPWLSAYMGHLRVLGTEVYLHATPELLRIATRGFERRAKEMRS
jgi:site-specific recombinase XerD